MTERRILWTTTDPRGSSVSLARDVWNAHVAKRSELAEYPDAARLAVEDPDAIYLDPRSSTESRHVYHYIKTDVLRGRFVGNFVVTVVKAIVEPDNVRRGYVSSVLFPGHLKKGLVLEWRK